MGNCSSDSSSASTPPSLPQQVVHGTNAAVVMRSAELLVQITAFQRGGYQDMLGWCGLFKIDQRGREAKARAEEMEAMAAAAVEWYQQHHTSRLLKLVSFLTPFAIENLLCWAARRGYVDVIATLRSHCVSFTFQRVLDEAVASGHVEVVQYLDQHCEPRHPRKATSQWHMAAMRGNLRMLEWLHANSYDRCTSDAMDSAATAGHLNVVQWLHEHRREGCSDAAIDSAALHGHLDVVRWLHTHRDEGCTTSAMDWAAMCGHLAVVEWLHANRTEGCTTDAIDSAAMSGHLEVVKFLFQHRTEGCTERAIQLADRRGHPEVVQYLQSVGAPEFYVSAAARERRRDQTYA